MVENDGKYVCCLDMLLNSFAPWISGYAWWRYQMEAFSALLALYTGNSPIAGEFPSQRPVTRSFDVFFDLRRNKRLSKRSWGWWFKTPWHSLWRHCNYIKMQFSVLFDWLISWDFLKWLPRDLTDNGSARVQVTAWYYQATAVFNSDLCRHIMSLGHNELIFNSM